MIRSSLEDACTAGLRVEVDALGDWGSVVLISEYDHQARCIRVDARALELVRFRLGDAARDEFLAAAVAHELYHHEVAEGRVRASTRAAHERQARAYARKRYGIDASPFEDALR